LLNERFDELFEDETYLSLKNSLFSYQLRRRHLLSLLRRRPGDLVFDLGSGISPIIPPDGDMVYVDMSFEAMRYLSKRHPEAAFVAADLSRLPFRTASAPTIVCSEVLEHVKDDDGAMAELSRILRPGGQMLLSMPVHQYYYTFDDRYVGHFRRYRPQTLLEALQRHGFSGLRMRKIAGALEKSATYVMARSFALLSDRQKGQSASPGRGRPWWSRPYGIANAAWSYVCWAESKVAPLALTTIVSVEATKADAGAPHDAQQTTAPSAAEPTRR
jgi:ubiquinone/menaquinone biosynthesis C-methylase UbiE